MNARRSYLASSVVIGLALLASGCGSVSGTGKTGQQLVSIAIAPSTFYLRSSGSQQLKATGSYSDGSSKDVTSQVTWSSANSPIAEVSASGMVTAGGPGSTDVSAADGAVTGTAHVAVSAIAVSSVLTYHNDPQRDGLIKTETTLTTTTVNQNQFGKRFSYQVDGQIYAQPLYLSNLKIGSSTHNVVFAATENNTVYAFDVDGTQSSSPIWHVNLGVAPSSPDQEGISPIIGITATPVIDEGTGTIYIANVAEESGGRVYRLHALDVTNGAEKFGGPVIVTGTVSGTGVDSNGGVITLEGGCYPRSGLALDGNNLYIGFGHCAHGWILSYNKTSLARTGILNLTPDGAGGAIWNGGGAPAIDSGGNLFLLSATDAGDPGSGYNDAALRLAPTLTIEDYFIPSNDAYLRAQDLDVGSGDVVLMPDNDSPTPHEIIGGGKDGRIFVLNRDDLGGFFPQDRALQEVQTGVQAVDNMFSTPAYWNGNLYIHCENDVLKVYSWSNSTGLISTTYTAKGGSTFGVHGATASVATDGGANAVVWEIESTNVYTGGPAVLHAYDASNVASELYNSTQAGSRDKAGAAVKFTVPTVADGLVFVGTADELDIYGLL